MPARHTWFCSEPARVWIESMVSTAAARLAKCERRARSPERQNVPDVVLEQPLQLEATAEEAEEHREAGDGRAGVWGVCACACCACGA